MRDIIASRRARPARHDPQLQLHEFPLSAAPAGRARHRAGRRHPVQPGAAPDRHRAAARRRPGAAACGRMSSALDPARPTEGSCAALLQFENGAAASLVYSGYDHFDSDEWHFGISERGAPKPIAHGAARRALDAGHRTRQKRAPKPSPMATPRARLPPHQPHFGITIVTCANGDMRASADGVTIYGRDGVREIPIPRGDSMPGRREVLDDCARRSAPAARPLHDGRWGKATVEVALAILRSCAGGPGGHAGASGGGGRFAGIDIEKPPNSAPPRVIRWSPICSISRNGNGHSNGTTASYVVEDLENLTFSVHRKVFVSPEILEDENRAHLRQVLDLCRPRLGGEEPRRLPHPQRRQPSGDLLPRPQGRGPRAVQRLPASRRAGLPRARGQHPAVLLHLSRLDLQHRRLDQGHSGRRRLSAGLRQAGQGPRAGAAA